MEGRTVHCSSLLPLIHPFQSLLSKGMIYDFVLYHISFLVDKGHSFIVVDYVFMYTVGVGDLVAECRLVGVSAKEKLRKVIEWVQRAGSTFSGIQPHGYPLPVFP